MFAVHIMSSQHLAQRTAFLLTYLKLEEKERKRNYVFKLFNRFNYCFILSIFRCLFMSTSCSMFDEIVNETISSSTIVDTITFFVSSIFTKKSVRTKIFRECCEWMKWFSSLYFIEQKKITSANGHGNCTCTKYMLINIVRLYVTAKSFEFWCKLLKNRQ